MKLLSYFVLSYSIDIVLILSNQWHGGQVKIEHLEVDALAF